MCTPPEIEHGTPTKKKSGLCKKGIFVFKGFLQVNFSGYRFIGLPVTIFHMKGKLVHPITL